MLSFEQQMKNGVEALECLAQAHWIIDVNRFFLADAVGAVRRLRFFSRIPMPCEVDYVIGSGDVQSDSCSEGREDEHIESLLFGIFFDDALTR